MGLLRLGVVGGGRGRRAQTTGEAARARIGVGGESRCWCRCRCRGGGGCVWPVNDVTEAGPVVVSARPRAEWNVREPSRRYPWPVHVHVHAHVRKSFPPDPRAYPRDSRIAFARRSRDEPSTPQHSTWPRPYIKSLRRPLAAACSRSHGRPKPHPLPKRRRRHYTDGHSRLDCRGPRRPLRHTAFD